MKNKEKSSEKAHSEPLQQCNVRRSSKCPFCGGSKIKPFISPFKSQHCTECNKKGEILNSKLRKMGLDDFIEKNFI
jgi:DnaJ-class molecular chaperone